MNDEVVWQVINNQFCSYKVKTVTQNFCRNEYNVTGLCNRQSCPLANSQYATVREESGKLYLFVKTVERSHMPARQWEKIRLSKNFSKALGQLEKELQYWPKFLVHKCKQRVTKMHQVLAKMRKLRLKELDGSAERLVGVRPKVEKRERSREMKAESAARLEQSIQKELLSRLKTGIYGDIYNFNEKAFKKMIEEEEIDEEDEEEEDEDDYLDDREFVEGDFSSDGEGLEEDMEDLEYEEEEYDEDEMGGGLELEYEVEQE